LFGISININIIIIIILILLLYYSNIEFDNLYVMYCINWIPFDIHYWNFLCLLISVLSVFTTVVLVQNVKNLGGALVFIAYFIFWTTLVFICWHCNWLTARNILCSGPNIFDCINL